MRSKFFVLLLLLWSHAALALTLEEPLRDVAEEARARHLFYELRCVVCQGESIADSNAQVATDMRREIRSQIVAGKADEEILDYFVARYGDTIFMQPPMHSNTAFLWFAPVLFILLGGIFCARYFRRQRSNR